jgi:hypothetical protein
MLVNRPVYSYKNNLPVTNDQRSIGIGVFFRNTPTGILNPLGTNYNTVNQLQVFTSTFTTTEQTKSQLINYILTNPGERFFDPTFGSGIRNLLFEQNVDFDNLEDSLKEKIENNVQNIRVQSVDIVGGDSNQVNIQINYSISNIQDTLTINLNNDTL